MSDESKDPALDIIRSLADFLNDFAPIPVIKPAADVLANVLELIEQVHYNKRALAQLAQKCQLLLVALKDGKPRKDGPPNLLEESADRFRTILIAIHEKVIQWSRLNKFRTFLARDEIVKDLKKFHDEITDCYQSFTVTANVQITDWQVRFEEDWSADYATLLTKLQEMASQHEIMITIQNETKENVEAIMDEIQNMAQVLSRIDEKQDEQINLQNTLYEFSTGSKLLLPRMQLQGHEARFLSDRPIGGDDAFDIYKGQYLGRIPCRIKTIRGLEAPNPVLVQRFHNEVRIWKRLWEESQGKYIVPLYGFSDTEVQYPYVVTASYPNGDVLQFVRKYPKVDRKSLVWGIADALQFLHSRAPPIIHGYIRANNVLIDNSGKPLLAEFGLAKIMAEVSGVPFSNSRGLSDSPRWLAPEACFTPCVMTLKSDVYSFAMTALEVFTEKHPFAELVPHAEVAIRIYGGGVPARPGSADILARGLDDEMWKLLTRCWEKNPDLRPTMQEVVALRPTSI